MLATIGFISIAIVLLLKPAFNVLAYAFSFLYFHFISERMMISPPPPAQSPKNANGIGYIKSKMNLFKNMIKHLIGHCVNGFIFYSILQTGEISFHSIRNFFYKYVYKINMEKNVIIYGGAEIRSPDKLFIGKGSIIGHYSILDARNIIEIGENVNFSHGVWLWTEQHNHNNLDFSCKSSRRKKITICDRAWLGPRVIVLPGCTIGEGAVVGAGAVVTKDIEPFSINVGIPAKKIGERNRNINYVFNGNPLPFI
jgi:acetyltransferase-like isoleucine patch superfamily enzyme